MNIGELLDKAKAARHMDSDNALAIALGSSRQSVSAWRHGRHLPDAVMCEKLAVFSGIPLNVVIGIVGEARAISTAEKRVWRKLATAIFVSMLALPTASVASKIPTNGHSDHVPKIGIMRSLRRLLRRAARAVTAARHTVNQLFRMEERYGSAPVLA